MEGTDEQEVQKFEAFQRVQSALQPRLEQAERAYGQALTSLWLGNAGATLATLSFIGAAWKTDTFPMFLLCPLGFFILGLVLMGVGALIALLREKAAIERMQQARSLLDFYTQDIRSPAQHIGLTLRDARTVAALLSGACFVLGCVTGFTLLLAKAT
jgi:hypothetical protein